MTRDNSTEAHSLCVQPAFLIGTYNEDGTPNFCPITWVSVTWDTNQYLLILSMFGSKKTKENIARTGLLSANLVSTDMLELLDYFGSRSGKDGQKDALSFEYEDGAVLRVPTLSASRWIYELDVCKTVQTGDSNTYFCRMKNVQFIEELKNADGIDLTLLAPVVYSGMYHSIGNCLGGIGDFYCY
ncbi:MAG: flavin reductase family protein [Oscillospiraceae bacterium]|nr:flavin reductase family protein [Oscillospiraceae bacterium]